MIYEPEEDSFLLEKEIRKLSNGKKILDMGSGSGIQARAAIEAGAKEVLAVDIDEEAIRELRKKGIDAIKSNLFEKVKGKFDLIVFNPPYLPEDKREDGESAKVTTGGKKGDEIILRFLKAVEKYLEKEGKILIVLSSLTPKERILKILEKEGLKKEVLAKRKIFMEELEIWKIFFQTKISTYLSKVKLRNHPPYY